MTPALEHARGLMQVIDQPLQDLEPMAYGGLVAATEADGHLDDDIRARYPHLAQPRMIAGRTGDEVTTTPLFQRRTAEGLFAALPVIVVWPALVPSLAGKSLLDQPETVIAPGTSAYLVTTWTLGESVVTSSDPAIVLSTNPDLELENPAPDFDTTKSLRWTLKLGAFDDAGDWQPSPAAFNTAPLILPPFPFEI